MERTRPSDTGANAQGRYEKDLQSNKTLSNTRSEIIGSEFGDLPSKLLYSSTSIQSTQPTVDVTCGEHQLLTSAISVRSFAVISWFAAVRSHPLLRINLNRHRVGRNCRECHESAELIDRAEAPNL